MEYLVKIIAAKSLSSVKSYVLQQKKSQLEILDPLSTMIRLGILKYKKEKTKISVGNCTIKYQSPSYFQGIVRWSNGDNRDDVYDLEPAIDQFVNLYSMNDPAIVYICNAAKKGLQKLAKCYEPNERISRNIANNIRLLENVMRQKGIIIPPSPAIKPINGNIPEMTTIDLNTPVSVTNVSNISNMDDNVSVFNKKKHKHKNKQIPEIKNEHIREQVYEQNDIERDKEKEKEHGQIEHNNNNNNNNNNNKQNECENKQEEINEQKRNSPFGDMFLKLWTPAQIQIVHDLLVQLELCKKRTLTNSVIGIGNIEPNIIDYDINEEINSNIRAINHILDYKDSCVKKYIDNVMSVGLHID
jgi:hypothetical protein